MQSNYNKLIKELYLDSNLYVNEFENYTDDIYFWEKLIKKYKPKSILEVGVGNGRLIALLHNYVEEYDGVDFSQEIINYCNENFKFENVKLYNNDFKNFSINKTYDLIIFPFNVINNFYNEQDIKQCFNILKKLCNENTKIIIDTINPTINDLLDANDYIKTNEFNIKTKKIEVFENKKFDIINSTVLYRKRYLCGGEIIKEYMLPNRIFFHQELLLILDCYGYNVVDLYGDYNFEKFNKRSRKQIFIFRRK